MASSSVQFAKALAQVKSVAAPEFRAGLLAVLGQEALRQTDLGFRKGRNPYGVAWKKSHNRTGTTLVVTGILRNSVSTPAGLTTSDKAITLATNVPYAGVHQYGASIKSKARYNAHRTTKAGRGQFMSRKMAGEKKRGAVAVSFAKAHTVTIPRRQYLPDQTLGPIWTPAFERAATAYMKVTIKGARP